MNTCLIIPAGGTGKRFGSGLPKQFELLADIPIIIRTIRAFDNISSIKSVVIATKPEFFPLLNDIIKSYPLPQSVRMANSGNERQDSVYNALHCEEAKGSDIVLIHDAVRPFPSKNLIQKIIGSAQTFGAAVPGIVPKDTIKFVSDNVNFLKTFERSKLRSVQTPQGFKTSIILNAYEKAMKSKFYATDDASLVEYAGFPVMIVDGEDINIKVTTPIDYMLASVIVEKQEIEHYQKMKA